MTSFRWYLPRQFERCEQNVGREETINALRLVVLELYVQTVFNSDLHLDGIVALRRHAERVYPQVLLLHNICYPP